MFKQAIIEMLGNASEKELKRIYRFVYRIIHKH